MSDLQPEEGNSYELALKAAGATVHVFQEFGSYQGDWWARVTLPDGREGWINGSYGSCYGCDAFMAEFDGDHRYCKVHRYNSDDFDGICTSCAECQALKAVYQQDLAAFGANYLGDVLTQEEAETRAARERSWDLEADEMVAFVRAHAARTDLGRS